MRLVCARKLKRGRNQIWLAGQGSPRRGQDVGLSEVGRRLDLRETLKSRLDLDDIARAEVCE